MTNTEGLLSKSIQPFIDDHVIAGAVLLTGTRDGAPEIETLGYANIATQQPMEPDTLFWIASNSKQITATALMLLVDEGKVDLEDPVVKYLPEFSGQMFVAEADEEHKVLKDPARPVNIRDLVAHTGGILPGFYDGRLNYGTLRERSLACALTPLRFEPGTKWEYGNGGFEVAGRILEVVSGQPFEQFLQARLFDPLGMSETTFWPSAQQLQRLALPNIPNPDGPGLVETTLPFTQPLSTLSGSPSPGGGLFSTAGDCYLFCQMVAGGGMFRGKRYLSEDAVRAMTTTQTGDLLGEPGSGHGYGLGWNTTTRDQSLPWPQGIGMVHHGGAHGTNMRIDPQTGLIKVFMIAQAGWALNTDSGQPVNAFWQAAEKVQSASPPQR